MTRHNERCKECKNTVLILLQKLYGKVEGNYSFNLGVLPEDYQGAGYYDSLQSIYLSLKNYRGYQIFVRANKLPRVDYFIPQPSFILEFDESQHFTTCRKITLQRYPQNLKLGFKRNDWIKLCIKINARDNDPPFRDEQRAWYDTLRDFLPSVKSLSPTIRLYAKYMRWCSLNPDNKADVEKFKLILEGFL
jgi:hypothetical protein